MYQDFLERRRVNRRLFKKKTSVKKDPIDLQIGQELTSKRECKIPTLNKKYLNLEHLGEPAPNALGIASTVRFAMHILMSSFRVLKPVAEVLELVLPHRNMATKAVKSKINFNTKHLRKGDPLPPYNGKLRLYNSRYCPFAHRTILALNAKQIDYEVVNINLVEKPEWLTSKSAFAKVPAIEINENATICESLVTVEYLDEVYPQRPLLPKDPVKKAFDRIIVEACVPIDTFFFKLMRMQDSIRKNNVNAYYKALGFVEAQLKLRGTKFLDGGEPGYADYMIWPWFERSLYINELDERVKIDEKRYKLLAEYIRNMLEDPAVSQYLIPNARDVMLKFLASYKAGKTPNYDLLLEE